MRVTPIVLWAMTGFFAWYFAAHSYERLLGNMAWGLFPQEEVFLALENHAFSIGLRVVAETTIPELTLTSHNFGFGLVVTGSVILGTRGRSWTLRLMGFSCTWLLLLLAQVGLLTTAGHAYLSIATQSQTSLWISGFANAVHPIVAIAPILMTMVWLAVPFEVLGPQGPRGERVRSSRRRSKRARKNMRR